MNQRATSPRRRKTQSGSALIEFALAFTLMAMLALGAVSFGIAVQNSIIVVDTANEGALFGANNTYNATYILGMQQIAGLGATGVQNFTATATSFCECTAGGSVVSCSSACGTDQPLYYVQVNTSATTNNVFTYLGLPKTFSLNGAVVMPVQ